MPSPTYPLRARRYPGSRPAADPLDVPDLQIDVSIAFRRELRRSADGTSVASDLERIINSAKDRVPADAVTDRFGIYPTLLGLPAFYLDDLFNMFLTDD